MILCNLSFRDNAFPCEGEGVEDRFDLSCNGFHNTNLKIILSWLRDDINRVHIDIEFGKDFHEE